VSSELFGPYRLDELIGRGGMGEVYRAYDTVKKRTVALKRLHAHLAANSEFQARFRREAEVAARLTEPHIVPIHDFGEIDGQLFIDMRLVAGVELSALIHGGGPIPPARAVRIIGQLASALAAAHAEGLIHRDVKPSNVLISQIDRGEDYVHLVDFGVARTGNATVLTATGSAIGTVDYMAPEQLLPGDSDYRVDIYALGCVLYETLTAQRPFPRDELAAKMYAHVHTPPPIPTQQRPELPAGLDHVVTRAMAKDPAHRYQHVSELAQAARQALHPPPPSTGVVPKPRGANPAGPGGKLTRILAVTLGLVLLAATAGLVAVHFLPATPEHGRTRSISLSPDPVDVVINPEPRRTVVSNQVAPNGTVWVLDKEMRVVATIPVAPGTDRIALSPDGRKAYVTNNAQGAGPDGGRVSVVDLRAKRVIATIPIDKAAGVIVSADGGRVYVTRNANPGAVAVIDTSSNEVIATVPVGVKADGLAITPDNRQLYVTNQGSNTVSVIDSASAVVTSTITVGANPAGVAISPDGRRVYVANRNGGTVSVIDTATNSIPATVSVGKSPIAVAVSPDGHHAYVTNLGSHTVSVLDTASNTVTNTIPVGGQPFGVAVTPDGHHLYIANRKSNSLAILPIP
jgi:serine/threonine-protein kinase